MTYFLQTTDMDFGDTPIENIFINDYMPMANGTYVKIYLLGYKYAQDRNEKLAVKNETIARHLNIPLEDVLGAWDFWEDKGIIEKIANVEDKYNYGIKFLNLKQLYIENNIGIWKEDKPKVKEKIKDKREFDLIDANQVPAINNMFNSIDYIMRRQTVPREKQKILNWIYDYNMNPDVVEEAFLYGVERRGIRKFNYVEAIIRNWYDQGLTNMEAVVESFKREDENYYRNKTIMKALGLEKRPIREDETAIINSWFEGDKFSLDLVLEACRRDKNPRPSINYVNGILQNWKKKGIKQVEDIEILDRPKERKEDQTRPASRRPVPVKTRFHNFEQRTDQYSAEELDARIEEISRKKRAAYRQEKKEK